MVALLAIVWENALLYVPAEAGLGTYSRAELNLRVAFAGLVEYRGLAVFAILVGFSLAARRPSDQLARTRNKRLIGLGVLHGVALFPLDVLVPYGVSLASLTRFGLRRGGVRRSWWLISAAGFLAVCWLPSLLGGPTLLSGAGSEESYFAPSWSRGFTLRLEEWLVTLLGLPVSIAQFALPMTLGYVLGDRWSRDRSPDRTASRGRSAGLLLVAMALGVPHALSVRNLYTTGEPMGPLPELCGQLGATGMAVALLQLALRPRARKPRRTGRLLGYLSHGGRNTLSGYLGSSLVLMILAPPYGLGLGREPGPLLIVLFLAWSTFVVLARRVFADRSMGLESWLRSDPNGEFSPGPDIVELIGGPGRRPPTGAGRATDRTTP